MIMLDVVCLKYIVNPRSLLVDFSSFVFLQRGQNDALIAVMNHMIPFIRSTGQNTAVDTASRSPFDCLLSFISADR